MRLTSLSIPTGLALAAAALVAVPAPAQAAGVNSAVFSASRSINKVGTGNCTPTNPSAAPNGPFTSSGATATQSTSTTSTMFDAGDPGDTLVVTQAVTAKARATEAGGQVKSFALDLSADVKIAAAQGLGTDCDVTVQSGTSFAYSSVISDRWVTFEAALPKGTSLTVNITRTAPVEPAVYEQLFLVGNAKGRAKVDFFLPAGTYSTGGTLTNSVANAAAAGDPNTFAIDASLDVTYTVPGVATTQATGTGAKYLKLGKSLKCAKGQLVSRTTKAAGSGGKAKVKKIVLRANGQKLKTVNLPDANDKVTLTGLPSGEDVTVKAVVSLFGQKKPVTVTRSYLSCS